MFSARCHFLGIYLYSDSRFFLVIIFFFTLAIGVFLSEYERRDIQIPQKPLTLRKWQFDRKLSTLVFIIIIGFTPNYLAMPYGLGLTHIESRFGWTGMMEVFETISDSDALVLADRAREFTWLTDIPSVRVSLLDYYYTTARTLEVVMLFSQLYNITHFLMDSFTLAQCRTMGELLTYPLEVNTSFMIDIKSVSLLNGLNHSGYSMFSRL